MPQKVMTQAEFDALVDAKVEARMKMTKPAFDLMVEQMVKRGIAGRTASPGRDKNITDASASDADIAEFEKLMALKGERPGKAKLDKLYGPMAADGFSGLQEYLHVAAFNPSDPRLVRTKMESGDPTAGGFLVPVGYNDLLMAIAIEKSVLLGKVKRVVMKTKLENFPCVIDTDHSSNSVYGGIHFHWIDEKGTKLESEPTLGKISLSANKCASLCRLTSELLEDSKPSAEQAIRVMFADALGWTLDEAIFRGPGAGQPLGFLAAPATIAVPKETNQAADSLNWLNVKKIFARMHPALRDEAIWLISPSAIEAVLGLEVPVGTGGGPALLNPGGGIAPIPDRILGRPILWTEHCANLGDLGDIAFIHPGSYMLGTRKELVIDASIHVLFTTNEVLLRAEWRGDGQPMLAAPLTIRSGAGFQVSPFVTLATRA